jgi:DNA repair ATPase RecN
MNVEKRLELMSNAEKSYFSHIQETVDQMSRMRQSSQGIRKNKELIHMMRKSEQLNNNQSINLGKQLSGAKEIATAFNTTRVNDEAKEAKANPLNLL